MNVVNDKTLEPEDKRVARRFLEFFINLKQQFKSSPNHGDQSLSEERYRSLLCLLRMEAAGLSELSERLSISASSLCIMLGKLEEEGLVERHRSKQDRRQVRYNCTEKGRQRVLSAQEEYLAELERRFSVLSSSEISRLIAAVTEIEAILSSLNETSLNQ